MFHKKLLTLSAITLTILLLWSVITAATVSIRYFITQPAAAATQNKTSTPMAAATEYRVYNNSTLGIKIEVPSDWLHKEINNAAVTFVTEKSLPQNASTTYRASVLVSFRNIPKNMSLDVFTQGNIKGIEQATPSFHLIASNSTTLAGNPAHQIVFTSQPSTGRELRMGMLTSTLKNGKAYIITYVAGPGVDKFPLQLPVVKHMIDSFRITKQ
jgi:hypothetical protein